jgi:hypothetical protein
VRKDKCRIGANELAVTYICALQRELADAVAVRQPPLLYRFAVHTIVEVSP